MIDDQMLDSQTRIYNVLKDGDELIVELASHDIWILLDISYTLENYSASIMKPENINAQILMRVSNNWSNKQLIKIIQKLIIKILNSYQNGQNQKGINAYPELLK